MKLRRLFLSILLASVLAVAYVASPLVSAWNLREAIKRGDTAAIEGRVAWPTVRQTLKASLATQTNLLALANAAGAEVKPSIWQRVKGAFGATMLDRFIESYVTPEGLPKLLEYRRMWQENVARVDLEPAGRIERIKQFWARIQRAEFQSPTRFELEVADRNVPDRRYVSVLELDGLGWKLTGLSVVIADPAKRLADLEGSAAEVR